MAHTTDGRPAQVAIVDYGMGNLFSVQQACGFAGLKSAVTSSTQEILAADAVILPGVGAFGDAMETLKKLDLVSPLLEVAASQKPLVGICLGMQLLMTESYEFGLHRGLGIFQGAVVRLDYTGGSVHRLGSSASTLPKVPQVGWNRISKVTRDNKNADHHYPGLDPWSGSPLAGLADGEYMYFVHSFYPKPEDSSLVLSFTQYGDVEFCSSLMYRNVFACQFHPERSGPQGLQIYRNLASLLSAKS
jgi:glutamine amidotransferase